ncbi:high frequency lysogenization protein HflD [Lysobacter sp. A3-1-A15]|uniref:high frequency lysogenization protein HflD n=1 Tax=Novilysobacter viscosus TaxID=3098602 RepID=UPI003983488E
MSDRVLALAGLAQALAQVRRIADTGQAESAAVNPVLDSVFRVDAASTADVYGGVDNVRPGLALLRDYFESRIADEHLPRLALAVMQLERRFSGDGEKVDRVQEGILAQADAARVSGSSHPDVLAALGRLYSETLSHLRPRVLVQGNPHYLGQPDVVAEVRAVLLGAMRSAVLWRQLGGSLWDLLLRRSQLLAAVRAHLGG